MLTKITITAITKLLRVVDIMEHRHCHDFEESNKVV